MREQHALLQRLVLLAVLPSGLDNAESPTDATSYRATTGGTFEAAGHWQTFGIPALRSVIWKCPSGGGNCGFP